MVRRPTNDEYSAKETKRRATDALRRALTTPYKPQKEMIGKTGRSSPRKKRIKTTQETP